MKIKIICILILSYFFVSLNAMGQDSGKFKRVNCTVSNFPEVSIDLEYFDPTLQLSSSLNNRKKDIRLLLNGHEQDVLVNKRISSDMPVNVHYIINDLQKDDRKLSMEIMPKILNFGRALTKFKPMMYAKRDSVLFNGQVDIQKQKLLKKFFKTEISEKDLYQCLKDRINILNNREIIVLNFSKITIQKIDSLLPIIQMRQAVDNPLWCFLYYHDGVGSELIKERLSNYYVVIKKVGADMDTSELNISSELDQWVKRKYNLTFNYTDFGDLKANLKMELLLAKGAVTDRKCFDIQLPKEKLLSLYLKQKRDELNVLLGGGKWNQAFELHQNLEEVDHDSYSQIGEQLLIEYGKYLVEHNSADSRDQFIHVESSLKLNFTENYKREKVEIYKGFYRFYTENEIYNEARFELAKAIVRIEDNDNNNFNLFRDKAEILMANDETLKALEYFALALKTYPDPELGKTYKAIIVTYIERLAQLGKTSDLVNFSLVFDKDIEDKFRVNYLLAEQYFKSHNYKKSLLKYQWLIKKWQKQNYVSKTYLQEKYKKLLSLNAYFELAIKYNKKDFQVSGTSQNLNTLLINLKAKYLKTLIDIYPLWYKKNTYSKGSCPKVRMPNVNSIPCWLKSIVIVDVDFNAQKNIWKKLTSEVSSLASLKTFPTLLKSTKENHFFLINKLSKKEYIVFEIDNVNRTPLESNLIRNILALKNKPDVWNGLFENYHENTNMFVAQYIANLLVNDIDINKKIDLQYYWNKLKTRPYFRYIAYHSRKGETLSVNFKHDNISYKEDGFVKSSKALGFYSQIVREGNDVLCDMSSPLYGKKGWQGVLRIGCTKSYE